MKKNIFILLCVLLSIGYAKAQTKQYYSIDYSTGMLLGDSRSFIQNYSWAGFQFTGQIFINDNLSVGLKFGLNHYYGFKDNEAYDLGDGKNIYASTYRYIRHIPYNVGVFYNILSESMIRPYVGFYIGGNYATENIFIQDFQFFDDQYAFEITPEIGTLVQFGKAPCGVKLSVSYTWASNQYVFVNKTFKDYQALNVNLGLVYMID